MRPLPYRAHTATGDVFDITFPLHDDTGSAIRVEQMLAAVLDALDRDINGDVLQALAMALAVRARMIHAPGNVTAQLAETLVRMASAAATEAERATPESGNA